MKVGLRGQQGPVSIQQADANLYKRKGTLSVPPFDPYARRLSMYPNPPVGEVGTDEFETLALERLKMLKRLETELGKKKDNPNYRLETKDFDEITSYFRLPSINSKESPEKDRELIRKDVLSHFALRLAYRKPDKAPWLIRMESELLRLRLDYNRELVDNLKHFQTQNADDFQTQVYQADPETTKEVAHFYFQLANRRHPNTSEEAEVASNLFIVHFTEVLDLVARRDVYLNGGMAVIQREQLLNMLLSRFRQHLQQRLEHANKTFENIPTGYEDRINDFLDKLPEQYLGKEFVATQYGDVPVDLSMIDTLAKEHFPLCMRRSHLHLRREHHMRHLGRLQYGLFLKGIGLTLEQSLEFWHAEFVIRAGEEGWKKKAYAYNIQYNYGQQGKRTNFNPYNCQKILNLPVNSGDVHGCPFRQLARHELAEWISDVTDAGERKKILDKASNEKAYTEACIAYYRAARFPQAGARLLSHELHPNRYYLESRMDAEIKASGDPSLLMALPSSSAPSDASMQVDQPAPSDTNTSFDFSHYDAFDDYEYDEVAMLASAQAVNVMPGQENENPSSE